MGKTKRTLESAQNIDSDRGTRQLGCCLEVGVNEVPGWSVDNPVLNKKLVMSNTEVFAISYH
jgi:hypothetical protein